MGGVNRFPWLYDDDGHLVEEKVLSEMADLVHYIESINVLTTAIAGRTFAECEYDPEIVLTHHQDILEELLLEAHDTGVKQAHDYNSE